MKTSIKKLSLCCTAITILISVVIVSCKKADKKETFKLEDALSDTSPDLPPGHELISKDSLKNLAHRMYREGTEEEYKAIDSIYRLLSASNLKRLFAVKKEVEVQRMADSAQPGDNIPLLQQEASAAADLRIEVNLIALQRYQRAINVLGTDTIDAISNEVYGDPEYAILRHTGESTGGGGEMRVAAAGCPLARYPYTSTTNSGWGWGKGSYGCYMMRNSGNDCDYEFRYDGFYTRVRANSFDTYLMLVTWQPAGFGDRVSRRHMYYWDGYDTGILLGARRVHIWCGHWRNVRMGGIQ